MKHRPNLRSYIPGLSVLVIGIALSLAGFFFENNFEINKLGKEFDSYAHGIVSAFEKEVQNDVYVLYSLAGLFDASEVVTREEFKLFAAIILRRQDDIMAVDWAPRLLGGDRRTFEESAAQEGFKDFSIKMIDSEGNASNSSERGLYFPLCYIEPFEVNKITLGLDLYSESSRREAMDEAAITGEPSATEWIRIFRGREGDMGCRVFMPIYGQAAETGDAKPGLRDVKGFVSVLFEVGMAAEVALRRTQADKVNVCIYDDTDAKDIKYLYFMGTKRLTPEAASGIIDTKDGLKYLNTFDFAGRRWNILCMPSPGFYAARKARVIRPWAFLALGLTISVLLAAYISELSSRAHEIKQEVREKTSELQGANRALQDEIGYREKAQSELRDTFIRLKNAQKSLVQSEKESALGRFSLGIAHEVKNPLAIILASADFLEAKLSGCKDEVRASVERIKTYTLKANGILENILQYVRPSELEAENIGINAMVTEVVALFKIQPDLVKTEIVTKFYPEDIHVLVDKNQMDQALFNIVKNAIEACPQGCKVFIKTGVAAGFGVVSVIDDGSGMSSQTLSRLFEPFFSTKRPGKGTGLGLFIAKTIIENNKGTLTINSREGMGTTVNISLPSVI